MTQKIFEWPDGSSDKIYIDFTGTPGTSNTQISCDPNHTGSDRNMIINFQPQFGTSVGVSITQLSKKLLFYAPLTTDKYPKFAIDGDTSLYFEGSGVINNGELFLSGAASTMGVGFNQSLPLDGYTISAFHTRTSNSGHQFSFASSAHSSVVNWTHLLSHTQGTRSFVDSLGVQMVLRNATPALNTRVFETVTMIRNSDGTYTTKLYLDGVLMVENTRANTGLDNYIETYGTPFIGLGLWGKDSSNGFVGRLSQFSLYKPMNDSEVMQLYQRGGIPEEFI